MATTSWGALIAAVAGLIAAVVSIFNNMKMSEVKFLVNGRLDKALKELAQVKDELKREVGDRIRGDDDHNRDTD